MPIYPVYLARWFPKKSKDGLPQEYDPESLHTAARISVETAKCYRCGGRCAWKKAWGHHSLPWGAWRCLVL